MYAKEHVIWNLTYFHVTLLLNVYMPELHSCVNIMSLGTLYYLRVLLQQECIVVFEMGFSVGCREMRDIEMVIHKLDNQS